MKKSEMKTAVAQAQRKPRLIFQILLFIAVFFVTQAVISMVLGFPLIGWLLTNESFLEALFNADYAEAVQIASAMPSWMLFLELGLTVVEILVPLIYCTKIEKRSLLSMGLTTKHLFAHYGIGLGIGALTLSASLGITALLGGAKVSVSSAIPVGTIVLFFALYMIQGAAEEVLVRGYFMMSLFNGMKGKHKALWSVIISAVAFAALHLGNPGMNALAFVNLFLSGVMFGVLVLRTDNLLVACAAHTAWNFVQGNVFGVLVSGMDMNASVFTTEMQGSAWISGGDFGLEGGIGVLLVESLTIVLLLVLLPKREAELQPDEEEAPLAEV